LVLTLALNLENFFTNEKYNLPCYSGFIFRSNYL
jgi:hypothetical protein